MLGSLGRCWGHSVPQRWGGTIFPVRAAPRSSLPQLQYCVCKALRHAATPHLLPPRRPPAALPVPAAARLPRPRGGPATHPEGRSEREYRSSASIFHLLLRLIVHFGPRETGLAAPLAGPPCRASR